MGFNSGFKGLNSETLGHTLAFMSCWIKKDLSVSYVKMDEYLEFLQLFIRIFSMFNTQYVKYRIQIFFLIIYFIYLTAEKYKILCFFRSFLML